MSLNALRVAVYHLHMGNQTSGVFWRKVNTFVIFKMKIFDFNLNTEWPEVLPNKDRKGLYCVSRYGPCAHLNFEAVFV